MKKIGFILLLACISSLVSAQNQLFLNDVAPEKKSEKFLDNELGIRYGAQIYLGRKYFGMEGPDLSQITFDYAHYYHNNIGFRTGLVVGLGDDMPAAFSVPMHFTWRSNRIPTGRSRRKTSYTSDEQGYYYNHQYYPNPDYDPSVGSIFWDIFWSIIPSAVELHTGFTPGFIAGSQQIEPADLDSYFYQINNRFLCSYDVGARLIIPVWRFNLFADFTYHCFLTNNLKVGSQRLSRSYMELGGGVSFLF